MPKTNLPMLFKIISVATDQPQTKLQFKNIKQSQPNVHTIIMYRADNPIHIMYM